MSSLGQITFFGVGRQKVCTEADLLAFIENQRAKAQHKADQANKQPTPRRGVAHLPTGTPYPPQVKRVRELYDRLTAQEGKFPLMVVD